MELINRKKTLIFKSKEGIVYYVTELNGHNNLFLVSYELNGNKYLFENKIMTCPQLSILLEVEDFETIYKNPPKSVKEKELLTKIAFIEYVETFFGVLSQETKNQTKCETLLIYQTEIEEKFNKLRANLTKNCKGESKLIVVLSGLLTKIDDNMAVNYGDWKQFLVSISN